MFLVITADESLTIGYSAYNSIFVLQYIHPPAGYLNGFQGG
jgi:hypothetical protein